jgi:hypothetical protein
MIMVLPNAQTALQVGHHRPSFFAVWPMFALMFALLGKCGAAGCALNSPRIYIAQLEESGISWRI